MAPESELILAIARNAAFDSNEDIRPLLKNNSINWVNFKDAIIYHGLAPFSYLSLKKYPDCLPKDLLIFLKGNFNYHLIYNNYLKRNFLDIYEAFERAGLICAPIKGMAVMEDLYAKYPVRPCVDIDILGKQEDLSCAIEIFEKLGYKKELYGLNESYWSKKQYHIVFLKKEAGKDVVMVEYHWKLDYPRKSVNLLPGVWTRLRDITIEAKRVKTLSIEDTFFAIALHQRRFGAVLSLKDACDIALLLNKYSTKFDWDYVLSESIRANLRITVSFILTQNELFFGNKIPQYIWKRLGLSSLRKKIISRFIQHNTFIERRGALKNLYLKSHFLLYDNFWEPIDYILNIPQEQFAKFYKLAPYSEKTNFLYKNRLWYILSRALRGY